MDNWYAPVVSDFQVSLSVLATVISKTGTERMVVDAGCKVISGERGLPSVKGISGLTVKALHAEHAPIEIQDPAVAVEVGDKIEMAVQYHDGTVNTHRRMYGIRNGEVERSSLSNNEACIRLKNKVAIVIRSGGGDRTWNCRAIRP